MTTKTINIAKVFSIYPGGGSIKNGPYSGEEFLLEILSPALKEFDKVSIEFEEVSQRLLNFNNHWDTSFLSGSRYTIFSTYPVLAR